jgi:hypothetical protein
MTAVPARADRAVGALFFTIFGTLWLEAWVWLAHRDERWLFVLVAVAGLGLLAAARSVYRRNKPPGSNIPETDAERRSGRLFHLINIGQWVLILIGVNVLNNVGLGRWALPFIILIIGAHFLPLAYLFKRPTHYLTGALLVLFALIYPFVAPAGPQSTLGPLGAGVILWASAAYALIPRPPESG